jgi:hypothetical protein
MPSVLRTQNIKCVHAVLEGEYMHTHPHRHAHNPPFCRGQLQQKEEYWKQVGSAFLSDTWGVSSSV